jgi:AICAR transformylase/IMP cyclohydrolase PurH
LEQQRNTAVPTAADLTNIVTQNKTLPAEAMLDMIVALLALKYTQSNSVCYAYQGQFIGVGAGPTVTHSLHPAGGQQGRPVAAAPASSCVGITVSGKNRPAGARQRH